MQITIGNKTISNQNPAYIIAEAGVNHGGNIEIAKKLVDAAVVAGVDAVKFQAFRTEHLIIENVEKAPYQKSTTGENQSQVEMLKKLELRFEHYKELKEYCDLKQIQFLITPFDEVSLKELELLDIEAYKIASTDTTNLPFLIKVAKTGKTLILSTGMCTMQEVEKAVAVILKYNSKLIILQCTANYPMPDNEANLNVLKTFSEHFKCILGYSDHSVGIGASPYAVALGAKVVEKHFTLDKSMDGPDHIASLNPDELISYVKEIRKVETFLGSPIKEVTPSEQKTKISLQKCLVAAKNIEKGELFNLNNIVAKRTGGKGISPLEYDRIIGTHASKSYAINDII